MAIAFSTVVRDLIINDYATRINNAAGTSGAKLNLYSGVRPVTGGTAPAPLTTNPLLYAGAVMASPIAGSNVIAMNQPGPDTGSPSASTGTLCTWARLTKADGTLVMDMNVSKTTDTVAANGGTIDLTMNDNVIVAAATITPANNFSFTILP